MSTSTKELRALTEAYVEAFNQKDIEGISNLMDDSFTLNDPAVHNLSPKASALEYISRLFNENDKITFMARNIIVDAPYSAIHFTLVLGETSFEGVDFIQWTGQAMKVMHAYLTKHG